MPNSTAEVSDSSLADVKINSATSLSALYSLLDRGDKSSIPFNSNNKMRINCYFIPKQCTTVEDIYEGSLKLIYRKDIERIVIEDDISDVGFKGYMDVLDNGGSMRLPFSQHFNYFLSINIASVIGDDAFILYEPYVCTITKIYPLDVMPSKEKVYRVEFRDILSGLANELGYASIFNFNPSVKDSGNFEEAFKHILTHLINFTFISTGGAFAYKKEILFGESGSQADKAKALYNAITAAFEQKETFLEAMEELLGGSATGMQQLAKNLLSNADLVANMGNIDGSEKWNEESTVPLLPLFLKEEYDDFTAVYQKNFIKDYSKQTSNNENSKVFVERYLSLRNFAMPFILAFSESSDVKKRFVYEAFNPSDNKITAEQIGFTPMMGVVNTPIRNVVHYPVDTDLTKRTWKNLHFMMNDANGTTSHLITFEWIFNFFVGALLVLKNIDPGKAASPNYVPAFHYIYKKLYGQSSNTSSFFSNEVKDWMGEAQKDRIKNVNKKKEEAAAKKQVASTNFCIYNSTTYVCKTRDEVAEKAYVVGKMLSDFVLLNESYSVDVLGSITRRPNEISYFGRGGEGIKENDLSSSVDGEAAMSIPTSFLNSDHTLFYVKSVTHIFDGDSFIDRLFLNKLYESV